MPETLQAGQFYTLPVERIVTPGAYLRHGNEGDEIEVFIYHDSENRLIATTQNRLL
jgi:Uncharacterized protein conserved in bacteria